MALTEVPFRRRMRKAKRFAFDGHVYIAPTIYILFGASGPFAILGRIALVIIYAFKGKIGRTLAHVDQKILK